MSVIVEAGNNMARPVRILATIYTVCDTCGPNAEHGFCASAGHYKCRQCGSINRQSHKPAPNVEKVGLSGAPLLDALDNLQRKAFGESGVEAKVPE